MLRAGRRAAEFVEQERLVFRFSEKKVHGQ